MKKAIAAMLFGVAIVGAALAALWIVRESPRDQVRLPIDQIVFITIDTLRADHVGSYGYPRATTPFLDRLASEGVIFRKTYTAMATTVPAHASIFTSLYPLQMKLLKNGHVLRNEFTTMAELMRQRGYKTAAFVSTNWHFKAGNMDQGFDDFDEPEDLGEYRPAEETIDQALQWLQRQSPSAPLFLWVHLFDPHTPLRPRPEFVEAIREADTMTRESLARMLIDEHGLDPDFFEQQARWVEEKLGAETMLEAIDRYDAEILSADRQLERLHVALRDRVEDGTSLWVVTADHGEGLGAHRWWKHGKHIYNEQLQVPLIFYFSSGNYRGRTVDRVVESVDILPTLLEIVGVEQWEQRGAVQGISLLALLDGDEGRYDKHYAFTQRRAFVSRDPSKMADPENMNYEDGEKFALQDGDFKLIYRTTGADEFYAVRSDPYERNDIAGRGFAEEARLRKLLFTRLDLLTGTGEEGPLSVDEQTIERLRAVGYVQ